MSITEKNRIKSNILSKSKVKIPIDNYIEIGGDRSGKEFGFVNHAETLNYFFITGKVSTKD